MKLHQTVLLVAVAAAVTVFAGQTNARADVVFGMEIRQTSDFYQPLGPYGYWVELPRYGRCWYPAYVDQGWRPYSSGHWLWTDDGWYWESEEPWAWATYHYGRWTWDSYYGWVWVPGMEWSPAWVAWREGGGYVGWAPLPPESAFDSDGFIYTDRIVVSPQFFIFVEHRHFCSRIRPQIIIVNNTIINQTTHIGRIHRGHQAIVNQGPGLDVIERTNPGRVRRAVIEQRLPADLQRNRQSERDRLSERNIRPGPIAGPQIIRGTRDEADRSVVVRPMPAEPTGDRSQPRPPQFDSSRGDRGERQVVPPEREIKREARPPAFTKERQQVGRPAPTPPASAVIRPKPQPLPPTAAPASDSDSTKYRRHDHYQDSEDSKARRD